MYGIRENDLRLVLRDYEEFGGNGDENGDGTADAVAWDNVTGKSTTFPPSEHSHSEYATTAYVDSLVPFIGRSLGSYSSTSALPKIVSYNNWDGVVFGANARRCLIKIKATAKTYTGTDTPDPAFTDGMVVLDRLISVLETTEQALPYYISYTNGNTGPKDDMKIVPQPTRASGNTTYGSSFLLEFDMYDRDETTKLIYAISKNVTIIVNSCRTVLIT